jgi:DNA modification methylase
MALTFGSMIKYFMILIFLIQILTHGGFIRKNYICIADHISVNSREKDFHDWQQDEEPFKYIIERFSGVGDLVLDPMAGAGTVLKVSKDLKRKCIAIDKNKECVEIMRGRLQG